MVTECGPRCADLRPACSGVCCASGENCAGGLCCAESARCGGVCCGPDQRCEGAACVLDCGARLRCTTATGSNVCCADGQVCYVEACVTPGAACSDLARCPDGQYCEPTLSRCLPRATTGEACEYRPPTGVFNPVLRWSWTGDATAFPEPTQAMMQPLAVNLTDDNGDGRIDRNDTPDVVFNSFSPVNYNYYSNGILRAVSGTDGSRIWPSAADPGYRTTGFASAAVAELDASSPGPEIVTCSETDPMIRIGGTVLIIRANGQLLRRVTSVPCGGASPAIADMDNDGVPEIAVRNIVFHADGTVLPGFTAAVRQTGAFSPEDIPTLADMDGDGVLELVVGNRVRRIDGSILWQRTDLPGGTVGIADLNADSRPEIVTVQSTLHNVIALNGQTGATIWGPIEVNREPTPAGASGGGPPTIADFDGDGAPDVATAGGYNYLVLRGRDGSLLWSQATQDTSSRVTGSSVFDFEGDGRAEAVYNDELRLRVYRGTDGMVLFQQCNTSGTGVEYPVIVDVDNDDHADIIVSTNNYYPPLARCADGTPSGTGIRVYSDALGNWVRTRKIWNQHTYHVTNIDDDAVVPRREVPNWTVRGLNNFRQNVQPDGLFDAPDLVASDLAADLSMCDARMTLRVRVVNRGRAGAPAGVPVTFYYGDPMGTRTRIGRVVTTRRLLPGESEVVNVVFAVPAGRGRETFNVFVVINDPTDMPITSFHECRPENNQSPVRPFVCAKPG